MTIVHDPVRQRVVMNLGTDEAVLIYTLVGTALDVRTISVPESYRGRGIAEQLARFVFEYAKNRGKKIIPTCPYLRQHFLKHHPDYLHLTAEDTTTR